MVSDLPSEPLPPAPKSILRNRASSLREVTLVDQEDNNTAAVSDIKPVGILKRASADTPPSKHPIADVQSEFIAKLKQKSSSAAPPPPPNRNLTSIPTKKEESVDGRASDNVVSQQGEPISTIGVLGSSVRTPSVKSDDMDLDDDDEPEEENNVNDWSSTDKEMWQEERQGLIPHQFEHKPPVKPPSPEPLLPRHPGPPRPYGGYNPYQAPRGYSPQPRPQYFRGSSPGGPPPAKRPYFPRQQQRMPFYRY